MTASGNSQRIVLCSLMPSMSKCAIGLLVDGHDHVFNICHSLTTGDIELYMVLYYHCVFFLGMKAMYHWYYWLHVLVGDKSWCLAFKQMVT